MPVSVDIVNFKCFNQLKNGAAFDQNLSDFTTNLVGNVGERVKITFSAIITQSAFTSLYETFSLDATRNEIIRSSGSFKSDRVQVGDTFDYYSDWAARTSSSPEFTGSVTFVSSDGYTLRYSVLSGPVPASGDYENVGLSFDQTLAANVNKAAFLRFGLLGNDESFNSQNKTTESSQAFSVDGLVAGTPKQMTPVGTVRDWVTGSAFCTLVASSPDFDDAQYDFTHEFVINPFYVLAYAQLIPSNSVPRLYAGDNSLKYAFQLEFRKTLTNAGSAKLGTSSDLEGSTGYYGENFNGGVANYEVVSTAYEQVSSGDPVDGLLVESETLATVIVSKLSGDITDYSCGVYLLRAPKAESEYIGTPTDMIANFLLKAEIVSDPATTSTNVTTSIVGGDLVIEYTVDYASAERLRLDADTQYLLLVQIEDPNLIASASDRVMLVADFRNYEVVGALDGFLEAVSFNFLRHGQLLADDEGAPTLVTSNEDGILLNAVIGADTTKEVVINSVAAKLIAFNNAEAKSFDLDEYDFNLTEPVIVGDVQEIETEQTRGYPLPAGDEFNLAKISTLGTVGTSRRFSIQVGQKIKWQEWILNPNVDSLFFDPAEPNNNLNEKSSNYSGLEGYAIRMSLIFDVEGVDSLGRPVTGTIELLSSDLTVNDYGVSADGVAGIIETFDVETGTSLAGNILYNGKDTLFKAIFTNASPMQYGIHRIEPSQNPGDGILELSSLFDPAPGNLLKPIDGETRLKFTLVGDDLVTECIIDGSLIQEGLTYKLSARVGFLALSPPTDLAAVILNDTTNRITWVDPVTEPGDQIEVWRSETELGTYTLIATVAAGTELYDDIDI